VHEVLIDGVPVFAADGPTPLTAGLVFGVGRRDESFVRGGITHLVEHLAMRALGRTTLDCNASVDLTTTEFTASGPADRVAGFLRSVCLALADLPTDALAVEADVLRAEGGNTAPPAAGRLLGEFYGLEGVGLASVREPAVGSLTAGDVRDWARTRFTRQNAALWLAGPPVEGLRLPLVDGVPPVRPAQYRAGVRTPGWQEIGVDGRVSVGAEVPVRPGMAAAVEILRQRVEEELRHRRGVAYAVEGDRIPVDGTARFAVVTTDVRPGHEDLAAHVLWRELQRLAHEGPTPGELAHERATVMGHLDDPRASAEEARALAQARVARIPALTSDQVRREVEQLTAEQVRTSAAVLLDRAVLGVPAPLASPPGALPRLPEWSADVVAGRVFSRRRIAATPRGASLRVGPDGASLVLGSEQRVTVRWADAVGLVRQGPDDLLLLGRDGFTLPVTAADWRDGEEAVALVEAAVPGALQVTDDDTAESGQVLLVRTPAYGVREAVGLSRNDATIVYNGEWTAIAPDPAVPLVVRRADLASVLGRGSTALLLRRTHADLEYVLLRGGAEVSRHRWGVEPADPQLLAQATGRPEHHVRYLHGVVGTPEEIAAHAVQALGLPVEVPALLAGEQVAGEHVPALGTLGGTRAMVQGRYDPPPGTRGLGPWWQNLMQTRPTWFRVLHAAVAVLCGIAVWLLFTTDVGLSGRLRHTVIGLAIAGVLYSVSQVRAPGRVNADSPSYPVDTVQR
jgi:predicted Zn-dependent peptidase